ncbi:MAG: flavodoxin [Abditibacteriota bacterium]|nr:flavodoxin [Abditibacteriota bacterium]MBP5737570.1 flavodoxin [Abditibacteriota bacterium]
MKKFGFVLIVLSVLFLCAGCDIPNLKKEAAAPPPEKPKHNVLVVCFSATGTTKSIGKRIAKMTGGTFYEIRPAKPYTTADLDWHNPNSRSSREMKDEQCRPDLESDIIGFSDYDVIYMGYPIWWGEAPKIMYTFAERQKFTGKTVVPFCTSGSSPIGDSAKNLEKVAIGGMWLEGVRFGAHPTDAELQALISAVK